MHASNNFPLYYLHLPKLELAVSRYPQEAKVWSAYEEYLRRDAAAGPLKQRLRDMDGLDATVYAKKAIEELQTRRSKLASAPNPKKIDVSTSVLSTNIPNIFSPET
jgi:hypothetical protein